MTKSSTHTYYKVVSYNHFAHGLCVYNNKYFNDVVDEIDEIVKKARERGFNEDEKWLIVRVTVSKTWEADGDRASLISSSEACKTVALYDNGVTRSWPNADNDEEDDHSDYEPDIKFYTSANPWDAPGMRVSDFL